MYIKISLKRDELGITISAINIAYFRHTRYYGRQNRREREEKEKKERKESDDDKMRDDRVTRITHRSCSSVTTLSRNVKVNGGDT